ncbi:MULTISPECIES: hypothetical protein [unclassified Streptomyces]|uniref:hypothetical protein n=1 Tax=unclassified Streptomyces TaxID=2593676 RepID=UPI001BFF1ADD|nr:MULTISPECIES: hypothetical protein [unclassified Streptomyces]
MGAGDAELVRSGRKRSLCDADELAGQHGLAKRRLRNKIPELTEAMNGRFREHHAFLTRLHLDQYDQLTATIGQLDERIEEAMAPCRGALDLLDTFPAINQAGAEVIIA